MLIDLLKICAVLLAALLWIRVLDYFTDGPVGEFLAVRFAWLDIKEKGKSDDDREL